MTPKALPLKLILLTWLTLFSLSLSAQKKGRPLIDSILRKLPAAREDTNKVNLWIKLSNAYSDIKTPDSAEFYIQHALTLTRQIKWPKGYYYIGHHYGWHARQLDKARLYLHVAAEEGLKAGNYALTYSAANAYALAMVRLNKNPESISYLASLAKRMQTNNARAQLAGIYALMGDFVQESYNYSATIAYYNKALGIEEADHRKYLTNDHILGIAYFNMRLHNFDKARSVLRKELKTISPADLNSQGAFAMAFAESYIQANDYKNGISYYEKVITIARKEKYPSLESGAENAIGWSYFEMKKYDKAYAYTIRSLALVKGDTADMVYPLSTLGSLYREAPDSIIKKSGLKPGTQYEESLRLLTICLNYTKNRTEWEQFVYTCYQELSKTYAKMHRYADAFKAYQIYTTKKDSLDSLSNEKAVLLKQAQLDYSHKEDSLNYQQTLTNTQLKQKKTESYFFVGGIAGLLLLSVFIWLNFNNQRKSNRLLTDANHQLNEQREEITAQRDQLSDTLTSLKTAQQQLIQSEKMASLGELTAGIAHEIQNPLNFVNNFSDVNREMLAELKEALNAGDMEEALAIATDLEQNEEKISHHGKRADGIVKGMLEHSRTSAGQKEPTDLNKLADEYLRLAYHGFRAKDKSFNSELVTHFEENLPLVNVVPQDIGRVLLNLFNNAFYAVQQRQLSADDGYQPVVEVRTVIKEQTVQLTVKDNGTGIPKAIKDKIMQPFFTTKPTGQGTGLGLSLSYDIVVKGHGGSIDVHSKHDIGSKFIVKLPA